MEYFKEIVLMKKNCVFVKKEKFNLYLLRDCKFWIRF